MTEERERNIPIQWRGGGDERIGRIQENIGLLV